MATPYYLENFIDMLTNWGIASSSLHKLSSAQRWAQALQGE